jgi:uncharacterized membrane protein
MEKLKALWHDVVDSLWFVPGLLTLGGAAMAVILVRYNDEILGDLGGDDVWWLFGGSAEGAMSVLQAIAGSIMTVTGVLFSVTIIALQLASGQYTPRVLRKFMADRANQTVLGVFIGTFTYVMIVLRTIRASSDSADGFVPPVAVTGAVLLTLISMGFLIFFINHIARSMQATVIIDSVVKQTTVVLNAMFPDKLHEWNAAGTDPVDCHIPEGTAADAYEVRSPRSGYVQAVERGSLSRLAATRDLTVLIDVEIGNYLLPGQVTMRVWPSTSMTSELEQELWDSLVMGMERTPRQDLKHGIIELMDIAVKALSPSINDPTTAVNVIQRLAEVLLDLSWRDCGPAVEGDSNGKVRLIVRRPSLTDVTNLAFNQIRHYGVSNPSVAIVLIETLAELAALAPDAARPSFSGQLHAIIASAREQVTDPGDVARIEEVVVRALQRSQDMAQGGGGGE